jgi:hypothetical protein
VRARSSRCSFLGYGGKGYVFHMRLTAPSTGVCVCVCVVMPLDKVTLAETETNYHKYVEVPLKVSIN